MRHSINISSPVTTCVLLEQQLNCCLTDKQSLSVQKINIKSQRTLLMSDAKQKNISPPFSNADCWLTKVHHYYANSIIYALHPHQLLNFVWHQVTFYCVQLGSLPLIVSRVHTTTQIKCHLKCASVALASLSVSGLCCLWAVTFPEATVCDL